MVLLEISRSWNGLMACKSPAPLRRLEKAVRVRLEVLGERALLAYFKAIRIHIGRCGTLAAERAVEALRRA